jgi:hypothetical protein
MPGPRHLAWGLVVAAMLAGAGPAAAQDDPMEEQRCVWRCLADSRGASDPAYHACVRAQCSGRPSGGGAARAAPPAAPLPRAQAWQPMRGLSYPAVGTCLGRAPCLIISCPSRGAPAMEVHAGDHAWPAEATLRLRFGMEAFRTTLPPRAGPTALYRWPVSGDLLETLKTADDVVLEIEGGSFPLSLAGSGRAIGGIESRCR